jgi:uncharacterized OsmC-like protein
VSRQVDVEAAPEKYVENISIGPHRLRADEPVDVGGADAGPGPYELILAALGACTSITVRLFAERRQWPLQGVRVALSHSRVHAEDCVNCDAEASRLDRIDMEISFLGDLSAEQRRKLSDVASKCPVHRTLTSSIQIHSRTTEP